MTVCLYLPWIALNEFTVEWKLNFFAEFDALFQKQKNAPDHLNYSMMVENFIKCKYLPPNSISGLSLEVHWMLLPNLV